MTTWCLLPLVLGLSLPLMGCGAGQPGGEAPSSSRPAPASTAVTAPAATATPVAPKSGVKLRWEGVAQVELTTRGAPRVLIDVSAPDSLSTPPTPDDILLTTHGHSDHSSVDFLESFPGTQLFVREGTIEKAGVKIRAIAAAHTEGAPLLANGGSDYIFVIDIGGLRIVHFGDIGQSSLTPRQAAAVGKVDVAITQFENSFSQVDLTNKKGFKLMKQVKPRVIIQTHSTLAAVKYAASLWPLLYSKRPTVTLIGARLPKTTSLLLLGDEWAADAEDVRAREVTW
jgi:L-ascorbate metabolism protein UlaG (beta-lactamase superfamily)